MKLRNKKTGEITELGYIASSDGYIILQGVNTGEFIYRYGSLAELCEEWEDYEEPKKFIFIDDMGRCQTITENELTEIVLDCMKEIGNYFETKEDAEKAVEKLKALTRMKNNGFKFTAWKNGILLDETIAGQVRYEFPIDNKDEIEKDLALLFGGEK